MFVWGLAIGLGAVALPEVLLEQVQAWIYSGVNLQCNRRWLFYIPPGTDCRVPDLLNRYAKPTLALAGAGIVFGLLYTGPRLIARRQGVASLGR